MKYPDSATSHISLASSLHLSATKPILPSYQGPITRSLSKPILKRDRLGQNDLTIDIIGADGLSNDEAQTLLYLIIKNKLVDDNFSVDHLFDYSYLVTFDLLEDAQYILDEYDGKKFGDMTMNVYF